MNQKQSSTRFAWESGNNPLSTETLDTALIADEQKVEHEDVDVKELIKVFPYVLFGQRVVVYEIEIEKVSGLFIPETSRREGEMRTNEGYVISVGEEVSFCKPGDTILYGRYSGAWQEISGKRYRIMNEEDILAIKKEDVHHAKGNRNGSS